MANFNEAIISIRPNFADAILSGSKTVELRRRIPAIEVGTRLWIYATRPVAAVLGSVRVELIIRGSPEEVWKKGGKESGLDRPTFDAYFDGSNEAVGLVLADAHRGTPISIEELRTIRLGFHPPQVIAKLSDVEANSIGRLSLTDPATHQG